MGTEKTCSACHGIDDHAPLPEAMRGRGDNCWICHNGPEFTYLFEDQPAPGASGAPGGERGSGERGSGRAGEPGARGRDLRAAGADQLTPQARPLTMSISRPTTRSPSARSPLWAYSFVIHGRRPRTSAAVSSAKARST